MTVLSDLRRGDLFLYVARVTAVNAHTGMNLDLYGPSRTKTASAHINVDGSMTGQLTDTPNNTPVTTVKADFSPVAVGDVLENGKTGETVVCRWSGIQSNGAVVWSASVDQKVIYKTDDWTVIGHVDLNPAVDNSQSASVSAVVISAPVNIPAPVISIV